jgi:hypothetical protein
VTPTDRCREAQACDKTPRLVLYLLVYEKTSS